MAVAKSGRLEYANMNAEQKERAEAWGEKWGRPATECPMTGSGLIITNRGKLLKHMTAEDYNIVTKHYRFNCYKSEFEENASVYSDPTYYISIGKNLDDKKTSIHLDKAVAEKV